MTQLSCPECGRPVVRQSGRGGLKTFCSNEHKIAFQARAAKEGRAIIVFAKAWREARNRKEDREVGSEALKELCQILDGFSADDRKAGRPRATEYVRTQLRRGYRYMDRAR